MSPISLSVLVCTHNPKDKHLSRVLNALKIQTLGVGKWELFLIDNASQFPLQGKYDLTWHPRAYHLFVEKLGKTPALLRGIAESKGDILVIVDDDNVLEPEYLNHVLAVFKEVPLMGVIGGKIKGEFEINPPEWLKPYLVFLAIIDLGDEAIYSKTLEEHPYIPPGAGMGIRRAVAELYAQQIGNDTVRQGLDPVGKRLSRSGDSDMALCALDIELAKGYFPQLQLTHLISKDRLELAYIQRLMEGSEYSSTLLRLIRGLIASQDVPPLWRQHIAEFKWRLKNRKANPATLLEHARERGRNRAYLDFKPQTNKSAA